MTSLNDTRLDRTFGALAHPIRRAILSRLARGEEASVTTLAEPFSVSMMAVSKHLKVLEEADLVRREKDGRVQRCTFDPTGIRHAGLWIDQQRKFWDGQLDALATYLEEVGAGEVSFPEKEHSHDGADAADPGSEASDPSSP